MPRPAGFTHTATTRHKLSVEMIGRNRSEDYRRNIAKAKIGQKNGMWAGDKASYSAVHTWLRSHYEKPKGCQKCGSDKRLDWASKTKKYKRDISEYIALCRSCHIKLDRYGSISI